MTWRTMNRYFLAYRKGVEASAFYSILALGAWDTPDADAWDAIDALDHATWMLQAAERAAGEAGQEDAADECWQWLCDVAALIATVRRDGLTEDARATVRALDKALTKRYEELR